MALQIKSTKLINKETGEVLMDTTGSTYKRIEEEILKPIEIDDKEITNKSDEIELKTDCFFFYMDKPDSHCLWFPSFDCKDCEYYISNKEADKIINALVNTKKE